MDIQYFLTLSHESQDNREYIYLMDKNRLIKIYGLWIATGLKAVLRQNVNNI